MMYALVFEWKLSFGSFSFPIPFTASGDDAARITATEMLRHTRSSCPGVYLCSATLYSLDDNRHLEFEPGGLNAFIKL